MDMVTSINNNNQTACMDLKIPSTKLNLNSVEPTTKMPMKRSFDVAFLMLPDEKLQQREKEKIQKISNSPEITISANTYPLSELSVRSDLLNRRDNRMMFSRDHERFFKYSSPSISPSEKTIVVDDNDNETSAPRSAFSKVTQIINVDSPIPSMSPDQLSCSSASPPVSCSPPSGGSSNLYSNLRSEYPFINGSAFQAISQSQRFQSPTKSKNLIYNMNPQNVQASPNGESPQSHGYLPSSFPFANGTHPLMTQPDQFMRNPTAALLTTLLPSSLGVLSMQAQNVCAKCNINFRMTSDLVYHMRSHHKNEYTSDPNRRRREEKLKCPVCAESFRERHHLTRHMTAHQDKEGDLLDHEIQEYHARRDK